MRDLAKNSISIRDGTAMALICRIIMNRVIKFRHDKKWAQVKLLAVAKKWAGSVKLNRGPDQRNTGSDNQDLMTL